MNIFEYMEYWFIDQLETNNRKINISQPTNGETLVSYSVAHGTTEDHPVQVLVYSNDGKWYPQYTESNGTTWTANIVLGDGVNDNKHEYYLLTVVDVVVEKPIETLPHNCNRSKILALRKKI